MGREVKRVALDFDWPLNTTWAGYLVNNVCDAVQEECDLCQKFCRAIGRDHNGKYDCPNFGIDPPKGEGYQMWETTTEGSPISPVFETPEKLAQWLTDTGASSFGSMTATYDQWLSMIKVGWAPSAVADKNGLHSGVAFSGECEELEHSTITVTHQVEKGHNE